MAETENDSTTSEEINKTALEEFNTKIMKFRDNQKVLLDMLVLRLNDKLQPLIITGQTILVSSHYKNYITWWLISLALGLIGIVMLSLVPFSYNPEFSLFEAPFYRGELAHVERALENMMNNEANKLAKLEKMGGERKMFMRHAFEKRKNVSIELFCDSAAFAETFSNRKSRIKSLLNKKFFL